MFDVEIVYVKKCGHNCIYLLVNTAHELEHKHKETVAVTKARG